MLVLSRKTDQQIVLGGGIKISILKIKGNVVRVGIEAPEEINIKRGELLQVDEDPEPQSVIVGDVSSAVARAALLGRSTAVIRNDKGDAVAAMIS
jgi:carbon storage regulator CsrA